MENYLDILEESLHKKLEVLGKIEDYNTKQHEIFSEEKASLDEFDEAIEEKGRLIEQLTRLDDGFESLYAKVSEELQSNRVKYAEQIKRMQELVKQVTDKSVSVQAQEARNKILIEEYFAKERAGIRHNRKSSKAAFDYYKSMSSVAAANPQFMDSKQ
ncbi:MAG: flagellar protein FliT [Lachnoclostridium sp.]|nr:flagellar protein FliT [Lachnospira sp.]MCM1247327.1 flagellar protein FliT [Lachnoclostridium sp.]MCM1534370.1 flagellar protein FliT [Clostridium sp.]